MCLREKRETEKGNREDTQGTYRRKGDRHWEREGGGRGSSEKKQRWEKKGEAEGEKESGRRQV